MNRRQLQPTQESGPRENVVEEFGCGGAMLVFSRRK